MYSGNKYLVYPVIDHPIAQQVEPRVTITEYQVGSPIRKFAGQSLFSANRNLSQSITSFIASYCQGIHQTPFSRLI